MWRLISDRAYCGIPAHGYQNEMIQYLDENIHTSAGLCKYSKARIVLRESMAP